MEELRHRWIDDTIIIDFRLPKRLMSIISIIEKADDDNDDIAYMEWCDLLENVSKESILSGLLTEKQREALLRKYN